MPADSVARELPRGAGFAGIRIQEARDGALDWKRNDWVAFLGAAYFRAIGELRQYGLSARGVALDVAVADRSEEFPDFTNFYIDQQEGDETITLYALMEGPSIVGAYKFVMKRTKAVIMDIDATLFTRAQVSRFGLCAADLDVLVLRDEEGNRDRLAPGSARFRRPRDVDRRAASGFGGRSTIRRGS